AWGANVGWIAFESTGAPKVDLATGNLSGYVWSANCGWISLSNAVARVQTDSIQQGTLAPNGLPIAWLLLNFGTTNISANADPTGKGMTITQDYLAGTDPNNSNDVFRITSVARAGDQTTLDWSSKSNRAYYVQFTPSLSPASWTSVSTNGLDVSTVSLAGRTNTDEFYRVGAFRPLGP
ncbi:MAG: hypothetical protein KGR98_13030, partial [Verrucomicrobia bacterium]|nr:hypothetical protein [Verrucomicrobiota bacterium]